MVGCRAKNKLTSETRSECQCPHERLQGQVKFLVQVDDNSNHHCSERDVVDEG